MLSTACYPPDSRSYAVSVGFFSLFLAMSACIAQASQLSASQRADENVTRVSSPDGSLKVDFRLTQSGRPALAVNRNHALLAEIRLGLEFQKNGLLRDQLTVSDISRQKTDSTYSIPVGKTSSARDHHHQLTIELRGDLDPGRKLNIVIRVFNDAVAFRYQIPRQDFQEFVLTSEQTEFTFHGPATAHLLPLNSFTSAYESGYRSETLDKVSEDTLMGLPLLLQNNPAGSETVWISVTEANLTNYAGMYLQRVGRSKSSMTAKLSPLPDRDDNAKVIGRVPFESPWRVMLIAEDPGKLIESNTVFNLNEPSRITAPNWIKPGKTTFPWWNAYDLQNVNFQPGVNTATIKHYIDFCADHGIPYHSLDGLNIAWYGGPITPNGPVDVTTAAPSIDLPEVLRYSKTKGVRLRIWVHWKALMPQLDEALAIYEKWGIEGIMVDFMNRDDQQMVQWYQEVARKAAGHHLTVTWHGAYKPTGMGRTWPNVLSYEAVRNQEYNKWSSEGVSPQHNLHVAFIRSIAGSLDYHQGGMRSVLRDKFRPRNAAPFVQGTRCHQLAMYVVYQNHLPMMADSPDAYRGQPHLQLLVRMPTSWDETRVLQADFGKCIVIARRHGTSWYVGGMVAGPEQQVTIPLSFLAPEQPFRVNLLCDQGPDPNQMTVKDSLKRETDSLVIRVSRDGGFVAEITPKFP